MNDLDKICKRIKDLREFSDYTVDDFAAKLNIDADAYREYEDGKKDIPIGLLYNIAAALEIDPTIILLGKDAESESVAVCYKDKGVDIERYPGYSFRALATDYIGRELEPMVVTVKKGINPELVHHKGQEFNYVLKGNLRVIVGMKEYYLRAGDSIYFDATIPHAEVPMDEAGAKFLTIIQN